MKTIYETQEGKGEIRRINVQIAATTVEDHRKLGSGRGTYVLFQETFHRETSRCTAGASTITIGTPRRSIARWRATSTISAGCYGLYDYRFEVVAQMMLVQHLKKSSAWARTPFVPPLRAATGVDRRRSRTWSATISSDDHRDPASGGAYTGMIISSGKTRVPRRDHRTRHLADERRLLRRRRRLQGQAERLRGRQATAGAGQHAAIPGAWPRGRRTKSCTTSEAGYIPSYCTACYRNGEPAIGSWNSPGAGGFHKTCEPNAILTFRNI